jgi:type II secretory pathway component GspD/PulD (secretin)
LIEILKKNGISPTAKETGKEKEEILISNTWQETDILDVLDDMSSTAGIPIKYDSTVSGTVTCKLDKVPLDKALELVLVGYPYVVKKTKDYYLVCTPSKDNPNIYAEVVQTRRVRLSNITAKKAVDQLAPVFREYVQPDTTANSRTLTVTAHPAMLERIISDIKDFDSTLRSVMLDARIVVLERGDLLQMGVEWGWPRVEAGLFSNNLGGKDSVDYGGTIASGIRMGYSPDATFTNALELTLNLLQENEEAKILSSPQVMAIEGEPAQIQVLKEEWFMMASNTSSSSLYNYAQLQNITSGTTLNIIPWIGDDNDITLDLAVEVSDSIPNARGSGLPVVTRRNAKDKVKVKDGGTAIVAGLTENRSTSSNRSVPGLSKLPLIGKLFNNTDNDSSSREVAVFVTAHLIPHDSMGVIYDGPEAKSSIQSQVTGKNQSSNMTQNVKATGNRNVNQDSINQALNNNRTQTQTPQTRNTQVPQEASGAAFEASLLDSLSRQNR